MTEVAGLTGHIEHDKDGRIEFGDVPIRFLKTHGAPQDNRPAIYILRDGREATLSLFEFWHRKVPVEKLIDGQGFGTWSAHLDKWKPTERSDTLLLRYETMVGDFPAALDQIATFIDRAPIASVLPPRQDLAQSGGKWIRGAGTRPTLTPSQSAQFDRVNGAALEQLGYSRGFPKQS